MRGVLMLMVALLLPQPFAWSSELEARLALANPDRGRLVFGRCRTCHYPEAFMGHNTGPNLSGIFGKVAGKQTGFEYYSERFRSAQFVWTPQLMYAWLEAPMAMFPDSSMMSLGVPDAQDRADLIAFLMEATRRDAER
jgi:cytochrome c